MKAMMIFTMLAAVVLGGCRREEAEPEYRPLKLGGPAQTDSVQPAQK